MAPIQLSFSNLTLADLRPLATIQDAGEDPTPGQT